MIDVSMGLLHFKFRQMLLTESSMPIAQFCAMAMRHEVGIAGIVVYFVYCALSTDEII